LSYWWIPFSIDRVIKLQEAGKLAKGHPWIYDAALRRWFKRFIFLCGSGHLVEGVGAFWWPNYVLFTWLNVATAAVSLITATLIHFSVQRTVRRVTR